MHHVVTAHMVPGLEASMETLGSHASAGADRVASVVLGPERHQRVSETVGAMGTIAKFIVGINDTSDQLEGRDYTEYVDYSEVHDPHYLPDYQHDYYQQYPDYQVCNLECFAILSYVSGV